MAAFFRSYFKSANCDIGELSLYRVVFYLLLTITFKNKTLFTAP